MPGIAETTAEESGRLSEPSELRISTGSATALELPSMLALLAARTATDLGRAEVEGLRPVRDAELLTTRRRRYDEARRLVAARPLVPSLERPVAPVLAAIGDPLRSTAGRDLVSVADLLSVTTEAVERIAEADPACEALAEAASALPSARKLLELLRRTFDSRGEIREDATPKLSELRGRIRSARQNIYDQLSSLIDVHKEHLSEETIPMRGGRLVMVLQSGARGRVPGLVHGRSGTGRSFYLEPIEAVEGNNRLQQAVEEEEAEKRRILAEVLATLGEERETLDAHADFLAELDALQAACRFAELCGGRLAEIAERRHDLHLVRGRHPLLDPRLRELRRVALGTEGHQGDVVPLDIELSAARRALVLTGPNAGGKTVALKTLGLLTILHQCGLPIPAAAGTRLPILEAVVATVGDDQDLLADRSTFSGRLLRLREAWDEASPDALVLLDELGSGTDPEEGAALSTALLEGLVERRSLVLVTTHLSQVAAAALETGGAFCAAMQFDSTSGEPTYRLTPGPPGGSEAISLAHRLGLPAPWLERAEALLGSEHRDLRRLLAEVENHRLELMEMKAGLAEEVRDAELLRRRLTERDLELQEERRRLSKNLERKLQDFRQQTQERLHKEVERLRQEMGAGRRKELAPRATARLFEKAPVFRVEEKVPEAEIRVGGPVRHRRLGWTGVLEKLERGRAQVTVSGKAILCKEKDLAGVAAGPPRAPKREAPAGQRSGRGKAARPASSGGGSEERSEEAFLGPLRELMLVGQRVEPALDRLDRFLDKSLVDSISSVRVIHGHGTGRLRDAVREHLRAHPSIGEVRPGGDREGGDGATIAVLR
ncbi:MAG: Smr/MutS family protein [Acidobacteriota bacterium]